MTLIPTSLIGSNDDYVEELRGYLYPRIHSFLTERTPLYSVGRVTDDQYVGIIEAKEEVIEKELSDAGLVRNPIACLKKTSDGRTSEGSWVLLPERDPGDYVTDDHRQLHVTLMPRQDGGKGLEVYAHDEIDWRDRPIAHLREKNFKPALGAKNAHALIEQQTFLNVKN